MAHMIWGCGAPWAFRYFWRLACVGGGLRPLPLVPNPAHQPVSGESCRFLLQNLSIISSVTSRFLSNANSYPHFRHEVQFDPVAHNESLGESQPCLDARPRRWPCRHRQWHNLPVSKGMSSGRSATPPHLPHSQGRHS
jgi:hypothetical protein